MILVMSQGQPDNDSITGVQIKGLHEKEGAHTDKPDMPLGLIFNRCCE